VPSLTHSDPAPSELSDPTLYSWGARYEINTGQRIAPCVAGAIFKYRVSDTSQMLVGPKTS
jgi:hypothetical protein